MAGDQLYLYTGDGLYHLDDIDASFALLYEFPGSATRSGSLLSLPGGGLLLAHADARDRRLIAFDAAGQLMWQRSYARVSAGLFQPLILGDQVYLLSQDSRTPSNELALYALDTAAPGLTRIFRGGTRSPSASANWSWPVGEHILLVQIGGGSLFALDVEAAARAMASP
jgi:hypothetical protein